MQFFFDGLPFPQSNNRPLRVPNRNDITANTLIIGTIHGPVMRGNAREAGTRDALTTLNTTASTSMMANDGSKRAAAAGDQQRSHKYHSYSLMPMATANAVRRDKAASTNAPGKPMASRARGQTA